MERMKTRAEFELWLSKSADRIENLLAFFTAETSDKLDYSQGSLIILGQALTQAYPSRDAYKLDRENSIDEWAGTYAGDVFTRLLGGKWEITLDDEEYAYLGIPGIYGHNAPKGRIAPVYPTTWITTAISRNNPWFIYDIVEAFRSGDPIRKR
jgi:hypothetical protein